jgi:superfamily II DNA or RNA helicase
MNDILMPLGFDPRPYQRKSIFAAMEALDGPERRALITLATGLGKTCVIGGILRNIRARGERALVLCDRLDLADQLPRDIEQATGEIVAKETGKVKGWDSAGITVATIETVRLWPKGQLKHFDIIAFDEAHRSSSVNRKLILNEAKANNAKLLGMTATPCGGREAQIDDVFGKPVFSMTAAQGAEAGWLRPHEVHSVKTDLDRNLVFPPPFNPNPDAEPLNGATILRMMLRALGECCQIMGKDKFIVFCYRKRQAEVVAKALNKRGVKASCVHEGVQGEDRQAAFNGFERGDVQALVNVDVLREGFDSRVAAGAFFMTRTPNDVGLVQMAGRVLRPGRGVIDGMTEPGRRRMAIQRSSLPVGKLIFLEMLNQPLPPIDELLGVQIMGREKSKRRKKKKPQEDEVLPGFSIWDLYGDDEVATAVSRAGAEDLDALRDKAARNRKDAGNDPLKWASVARALDGWGVGTGFTRSKVATLDRTLVSEVNKRLQSQGVDLWGEDDDRWNVIASANARCMALGRPSLAKMLFVEALGMDVATMEGAHIEQVFGDMMDFRRKLEVPKEKPEVDPKFIDELWKMVSGAMDKAQVRQ